MKKIFSLIFFLVCVTVSYSQTGVFSQLQIGDKRINKISDDSSLAGASHVALPTEWAVKNYFDNRLSHLTITTGQTFIISSQSAMLALAANVGDVAVRSDSSKSFILQAEPASTLGNWVQLLFPGNITSIFGRTGAVVANGGDYSAYYSPIGHSHTIQTIFSSSSLNGNIDITGFNSGLGLDFRNPTLGSHTQLGNGTITLQHDDSIVSLYLANSVIKFLNGSTTGALYMQPASIPTGNYFLTLPVKTDTVATKGDLPTFASSLTDSTDKAVSSAWVKQQFYLASLGVLPAGTIPYSNGSAKFTWDASGLYYDGTNLQVGHSNFNNQVGLLLNGGRATLTASGFGAIFKTQGGTPADPSKHITFQNSDRTYFSLNLDDLGTPATTPMYMLASIDMFPAITDSFSLGKSSARWKNGYFKNLYVNGNLFTGVSTNDVDSLGGKPASYYATSSSVVVNAKNLGAKGDGATDDTGPVQTALDLSTNVYFPPGTYIVSNLKTNNKQRLFGAGSSSSIKFKTGSTGYMISFKDSTYSTQFSDLDLDGGDNVTMALDSTIGNRSAIHISTVSSNSLINNVSIHGFDSLAVGINGIGSQLGYAGPLTVSNSNIYFNSIGINTGVGAENGNSNTGEYMKFSNLTVFANRVGIIINSGNNTITGSHFDTNGYAVKITNAFNNGHGTITGSTVNHNLLYGFYVDSVTNGFSIVGNQNFYSNLFVRNSKGINIQGNSFANSVFTLTNGGMNYLKGNYFTASPTINRTADNFLISDNFYTDTTNFVLGLKDLVVNNNLSYNLTSNLFSLTGNQYNTGKIGVGISPTETFAPNGINLMSPNVFAGTTATGSVPSQCCNLTVTTSDLEGKDIGGVLGLGGRYLSTFSGFQQIIFGGIKGGKANSTSSNFDGYLGLYTNKAGTLKEVGRFNEDGKFGINTLTPTQKLQVNGQVKIDTILAGAPGIDSILTVKNGIVNKIDPQSYLTPTVGASTYVPKTTTINGHTLSSNVTVSATDINSTTGRIDTAHMDKTTVTFVGPITVAGKDTVKIRQSFLDTLPVMDATSKVVKTSNGDTLANLKDVRSNTVASFPSLADRNYANDSIAVIDGGLHLWDYYRNGSDVKVVSSVPTSSIYFTYTVDNSDGATSSIQSRFAGYGSYENFNLTVNWGDGNIDSTSYVDTFVYTPSHTYSTNGVYHVIVHANLPASIHDATLNNSGTHKNIIDVHNVYRFTALQNLTLSETNIESVDTIKLPSTLLTLKLRDVGTLTSFNPTTALPNLTDLVVSTGTLTSFAPTIPLPASLTTIELTNNWNVTQVNNALIYLDSQTFTNPVDIDVSQGLGSTPTGAGATAKASLIAKGNTVTTD